MPKSDWFTTYRSISGGEVLMGNNMICKVLGTGIVRIKMYDGVVRTLSNVRHMPDLRKNILSLGIFNSQGYKYTSEGGVLRISKGGLVFIKGKLVNSLYMLQGSTTVVKDHGVGEQVELEVEALWVVALGEEIVSPQYLKGIANIDLVHYRASTKNSSIVG
ncbi:hypothetical protein RGQ29_020135 [Quercus rubra]|uniref:Retrovirus-related Pol polyprotein from transposon TNT 1-94-like beta-barrel domain-containing protein n=1 Tax=Quercus rubra TaxID=3512 RepID=A0AAN7FE85_QUERU|nr:hypothetical protein RGQ29_020135 [Quercus rubra]